MKLRRNHRRTTLKDIRNGEQRGAEIRANEWHVVVKPFRESRVGPIPLAVEAGATNIVYAVGSLKNGTFEPIVQILP